LFYEDGHALLTDFGLSKEGMTEDDFTASFCGSVAYLASEVLDYKQYNKAVDWYLFDIFIYEMLVGCSPFYSNNKYDIS
jgi:serine/threonine protein kinase